MMAVTSPPPSLLKKRQRHSRVFALALIPLAIFCSGMLSPEGFWHETLDWFGLALVIICVLGRTYCSVYIGGIKNERVVREGPFSVVRNPLYVFSFLGVIGIGLQSGMATLLGMLVGAFISYYPQVVAKEEAYLLHKFGDEYQKFLNEVPRWIPRFSLWSEPAEVVVRPYFVRHTIMDALAFFIPMVCFELLEVLHNAGYVPMLLKLP